MIPVASIEPHPGQPRRIFHEDSLAELAESIETRGVIQPIIVRPHGHRFQIVAGERRWRAAQKARLHEIPSIVRDFSEEETLEIALIENIQRQDLNAIEEAQAYRRLVDDYGHTQEELGKIVHKSRSHVANLLRLLDLPAKVQVMVGDRRIEHGPRPGAGHRVATRRRWPRRSCAAAFRCARPSSSPARGKPTRQRPLPIGYKGANADIAALERQLGDMLGLKVAIKHAPKGGTVTLTYSTLDQLDMICQRLSGDKF